MGLLLPIILASFVLLQVFDTELGKPKSTENSEVTTSEIQTSEESNDSNGLENFGIEEESFELFNSDNEENSSEQSLDVSEETSPDEDDLEIPAFLRRQKN